MFFGRLILKIYSRFLAALFLYSLAAGAHALSDQAATGQVQAQLIASVDAVRPGQKILLGVRQRIAPHWHTYWINPGDSGISTKIVWDLPQGATAGNIQWPHPARFTQGPVTNYGYSDEVILLSEITIPDSAKVGAPFPISAKVSWLVCQEICIPQQVQLSLALPIVANTLAGTQALQSNPLIEKARAALPLPSPWVVSAQSAKDGLWLKIDGAELASANVKAIWFYADQWGKILHSAPQPRKVDGQSVLLKLQPGEAPPIVGESLTGVLVVSEMTPAGLRERSFIVDAVVKKVAATVGETSVAAMVADNESRLGPSLGSESESGSVSALGLTSTLLLALLGGVILNLMPCVFPVLSIKALSLLEQTRQTPRQARLHGLTYTAGILSSFLLLGAVLIALKAAGSQIGWGFQFQSPLFVLAMAYLIFAVGLSLSGVFDIGTSITGVGSSLAGRSGYAGSFFTGVLATIVATPCTAPFMGGALGYALTQPPAALIAVFLSLGFGLALPYLTLSTWPLLQHCLPRPGRWMEGIKQGLAFPMYGAAVWLVWVLAEQAGINAVAIALGGMVCIAFAAWLYETSRASSKPARYSATIVAGIAVAIALIGGTLSVKLGISTSTHVTSNIEANIASTSQSGKNWTPYTLERLHALRAEGKPVFVNLTAAWCITCLVNERVALSEHSVQGAFQKNGITYLKGDWTNQDPAITQLLKQFGRSGVPLYVFYPNGLRSEAAVLPQILTPQIVVSAVNTSAISVTAVTHVSSSL